MWRCVAVDWHCELGCGENRLLISVVRWVGGLYVKSCEFSFVSAPAISGIYACWLHDAGGMGGILMSREGGMLGGRGGGGILLSREGGVLLSREGGGYLCLVVGGQLPCRVRGGDCR